MKPNRPTSNRWGLAMPALIAAFAMTGCQREAMPVAQAPATKPAPPFDTKAVVGVPVQGASDPQALSKLVASRSFSIRGDAYGLFPTETQFENSQAAENLFQQSGRGFTMLYEPVEEVITEFSIEPQPYRRLAGILVGETVAAIIMMEDGKAYIVRPGMKIPNSEWTVVSISTNPEQAILRREGDRLPKQINVRLESPPSGFAGGGNQNAPQNPGGGDLGGRAGVGGGGPGARGGGAGGPAG